MRESDLINLSAQFMAQGERDLAIKILRAAHAQNPEHAATNLNLFELCKSEGNLIQAREFALKFLNSPQTGFTGEAVPKVRQELSEIEKKLTQPPAPKQ